MNEADFMHVLKGTIETPRLYRVYFSQPFTN